MSINKGTERSHSENIKHLNKLNAQGKLASYFNKIDGYSLESLMGALSDNNIDSVSDILKENLSSGGQGLNSLFDGAYDNQIEELAKGLVESSFRDIEVENLTLFKQRQRGELDDDSFVFKLRDKIEEIESLPDFSGFVVRKQNILKQLSEAEKKISVPENIEKIAVDLVKSRGRNIEDIRTARFEKNWKYGKDAIVVWGKKGFLAVDFIDKKPPRQKKPKLKYTPAKKDFREKTIKQITTRKGQDFSVAERFFIIKRRNKPEEEIINDYLRINGDVRPKSEIKKLISGVKSGEITIQKKTLK